MVDQLDERAEAKRLFMAEYGTDLSRPSLDARRVRLAWGNRGLTKIVIKRKMRLTKETGEGTPS